MFSIHEHFTSTNSSLVSHITPNPNITLPRERERERERERRVGGWHATSLRFSLLYSCLSSSASSCFPWIPPHCQVSSFLLIYIYIYFCYMIHYLFFFCRDDVAAAAAVGRETGRLVFVPFFFKVCMECHYCLPFLPSFLPSCLPLCLIWFENVLERCWKEGKGRTRELCYYFSVIDL
jgi:hypothetical protein